MLCEERIFFVWEGAHDLFVIIWKLTILILNRCKQIQLRNHFPVPPMLNTLTKSVIW